MQFFKRLFSHPILLFIGLWVVVVAILAYRYPAGWHSWLYGEHARPAAQETAANGVASTTAEPAPAPTASVDSAAAPTDHWHGYAPTGSAPAAAVGSSTSEQESAAAPALTDAQRALLMRARTAFWQHDLPGAEKDYQQLIEQVPGAPAPHGELGNLYYLTGRGQQAGEQYAAAAKALIALNRQPEAAAMLPLVGSLDPQAARDLAQALGEQPLPGAGSQMPPMPPPQPSSPPQPSEGSEAPQGDVPTAPNRLSKAQHKTLMKARQAFMRHDVTTAKQEYLKLIAELPKAAAPHGELGNLYFMTGKKKDAAEQYALAAQALIAEGQPGRAQAMLPMIASLDPAQADAVRKTLQAASGNRQP